MEENINKKIKIGYGAGSFLEAGLYNFMTTYLMLYLTSVAMLSPSVAGSISSTAILMEAVGGIVAGHISDQFYSKWGRRRPIMLAAIIILCITVPGIFFNTNLEGSAKVIYYFVLITIFWMAYSTFYIPYIALGAEMTSDYDERISIRTHCRFFSIIGNLVCTVFPLIVVSYFVNKGMKPMNAWLVFAIIMMLISAMNGFISWHTTKGTERLYLRKVDRPKTKNLICLLKEFYELLHLRMYNILLLSRTFFLVSYSLYTASLIYFVKYKLGYNDAITSTVFIIGIVASFLYMPVIAKLAVNQGKRAALTFGMLLAGAGGIILKIIGINNIGLTFVYICLFTYAHSSCWQIYNSMFYDITEIDQFVYGKRREGGITSLMSVFGTISVAIGLKLMGTLLDFVNYNPNVQVQSDSVIRMIENIFVVIPSGLLLAAGAIMLFYPMNKTKFNTLKKCIQKKENNESFDELMPEIKTLL